MPKIEKTYTHTLNIKEAFEYAKVSVNMLLQAFEATEIDVKTQGNTFLEFSCKSLGFDITGSAIINPENVFVVINLPWAAMGFKGRVDKALDKQFAQLKQM